MFFEKTVNLIVSAFKQAAVDPHQKNAFLKRASEKHSQNSRCSEPSSPSYYEDVVVSSYIDNIELSAESPQAGLLELQGETVKISAHTECVDLDSKSVNTFTLQDLSQEDYLIISGHRSTPEASYGSVMHANVIWRATRTRASVEL